MQCFYCGVIAAGDSRYRERPATRDLGSPAPRCAVHWRYVCGACGRSAHFMASAFCPDRRMYFCHECAPGREAVDDEFFAWKYYFRYRSPWTGEWRPALDRLEFEGRHPALGDAGGPAAAGSGIAAERLYPRHRDRPQQWRSGQLEPASVRAIWNENAARWNSGLDTDGDETRKYFSDEPMLALLGGVAGLDILDMGCGNGYLSRKLARMGARVTGVDLTERMIDIARKYEHDEPLGIRYLHASITDLGRLESGSIDGIVSNYVLHDLPELAAAVGEAYRLLRPAGRFVPVIPHPCFSCGPRQWTGPVPDSPRPEELAGFAVDHYFLQAGYLLGGWEGFSPVPYFHRPLREYWRVFRTAGFDIDEFDEPMLNERGRAELPNWQVAQADRIPLSCVFRLLKT